MLRATCVRYGSFPCSFTLIAIFQLIVKNKGPQRQEVLKEFSKHARAQLEQAKQNEKDAADANALIKGYKALLRS